ncbi:hypothetical protein [Candidatus Nitrotoga arctica]|uniref:Uncharacterized protein n=1 Tax=Candidatus Nitrotoga arctica TaxID=453162 RepID=A0ABN8AJS3_9PROT|nr:hypothetical protein [Candidatus Nitrotoga arctica]CAG9931859.1 protein of unknown function [Candidatus Nitrotoga arctica]
MEARHRAATGADYDPDALSSRRWLSKQLDIAEAALAAQSEIAYTEYWAILSPSVFERNRAAKKSIVVSEIT